MTCRPLQFVRRGEIVSLDAVAPDRTLLQVLREDLQSTDTKEGCNEGDCGACTVVIGESVEGRLHMRAVNSCIKLAHSVDGLALWTAGDLAARDGTLHPAQQALVQCHGSQCGFCTPGFVMSLFALYQNQVCQGKPVSRAQAQTALSGNLCRCTGYRPILEAATHMAALPAPALDEAATLQLLQQIKPASQGPEADSAYLAPLNLQGLLQARAAWPDAQLVAGCTDVGLWINKAHRQFERILDVSRVAELREIQHGPDALSLGAAVTLENAYAALITQRPQLTHFANRFAGLPVRNAGTLGGNVANGSPIGDSMPLLIALGARVVLASVRGEREMPLEALYTGYRQTVLAPDEVLAWIRVPHPQTEEFMRVYKVSKRFDDDISAVCLAVSLHIAGGVVTKASIGAGGVAATPVRARQTEASLIGQAWNPATVKTAAAVLRDEFAPISDMRASATYRTRLLGNLLQRFWLESQGAQGLNLEAGFSAEVLA